MLENRNSSNPAIDIAFTRPHTGRNVKAAREITLDRSRIGGKAAGLLALQDAGLPVPPFSLIPCDLWRKGNLDLLTKLDGLTSELDVASDAFTRRILTARLRKTISEVPPPPNFVEFSEYWVAEHGSSPFTFVRSSAATEDRFTDSSAGQYTSLPVPTAVGSLLKAQMEVTASYYTDRAVMYRRARRLPQCGPAMGIILQRAISPVASGVMFGCDPVSNDMSVIVVEATHGLGTALVEGRTTPDRWRLIKRTGDVQHYAPGRNQRRHILSERGILEEDVPSEVQVAQVLNDQAIRMLWSIYREVEKLFGIPQDVEWLQDQSQVWVVQSRAVTTTSL